MSTTIIVVVSIYLFVGLILASGFLMSLCKKGYKGSAIPQFLFILILWGPCFLYQSLFGDD